MELWQTIIAAIVGNTLVLSVLGWLAKSFVEKLIQRDSKKFEIELKAKVDASLEHYKSELQLKTIEHQIKLSRLHDKRAIVIAEFNSLLAEVMWEAESFLSPMEFAGEPSKQEKHAAAMNKLSDFFRYFDKHRIYLPQKLGQSAEAIALEVRQHVIRFGVYLRWDDAALMDHTRKEKEAAWLDGWKLIKERIPTLRGELENEFRLLLESSA
jgi:hypothetical protein